MSYYDDNGEYVGYDPYIEHDRRVHREQFHKSEVPTVHELVDKEYTNYFIEKSKELVKEPECDSTDFMEQYVHNFSKTIYNAVGDIGKTMELIMKDHQEHNGDVRIIATSNEHIVREGTETFIVYKVGYPEEVLGVFFDEETAVKFKESYK